MKNAYVHVYTGNGKGKTTAALGLAMRAAGRGLSVKIVQFLKGRDSGEQFVIDKIENIELVHVSACKKFFNAMDVGEREQMRNDVCDILSVVSEWLDTVDLVILDEALGAISCGILTVEEVCGIIDRRQCSEIVLTGRNAPPEIMQRADLVTEMKDVKHYMDAGVGARCGIEY